MDKQSLSRSMQRQFGHGMILTREFSQFMGISYRKAADMLKGLDYVLGAYNAKQYSVDDVAEMIMRNRG